MVAGTVLLAGLVAITAVIVPGSMDALPPGVMAN
jgi:hypothetical protein